MASDVLAGAASIGCSVQVFLGYLAEVDGGGVAAEAGSVNLREDL